MSHDPDDDAALRPWLEAIGFDVPGQDGPSSPIGANLETGRGVSRQAAGRTHLARPSEGKAAYPRLSDRAPRRRIKILVMLLGAAGSLTVMGVLVGAAYLSGLDRHYGRGAIMVEASTSPQAARPPLAAQPAVPPPIPQIAELTTAQPAAGAAPAGRLPIAPPLQGVASPAAAPPDVTVLKRLRQGPQRRDTASNVALSTLVDPPRGAGVERQPTQGSNTLAGVSANPGGAMARARVVIHVPDGYATSDMRAERLSAELASNVGRLETRHVATGPSGNEIRFFHSEDFTAAHALVELLATEGPWRVRDFSQFRPLPSSGTLEVWLLAS